MISRTHFLFPLFCFFCSHAQDVVIPPESILYNMKAGDSAVIYQCHVQEPEKMIDPSPDYVQVNSPFTISDKFILKKTDTGFVVSVWGSHIHDFPNRKFSGLKIRERPYWNFVLMKRCSVPPRVISRILLLEQAGRDAIEYDYPVTRYTRNQLILKRGRKFSQLVLDRGGLVNSLLCN